MNKIKTIFFSAILVALTVMHANAQSMVCPDISLPYYSEWPVPNGSGRYYYDQGEVDLNNVPLYLSATPPPFVVRWQGATPIQINYTTPQMTDHSMYNNCVKQADLDACIANDFAEWTNICPGMFTVTKVSSIPAGSSGITIQWSSETDLFPEGPDQNGKKGMAGGETKQFNGMNLDPTTSTFAMVNPVISLNNDYDFNQSYIFTTCPQVCTTPPNENAVSICEVMLHEIGHAFGLEDLGSDPDPNQGGENYPQGVMWGDIEAVTNNPCPDKTLQDVDHCYFCKLYCPQNCLTLGAPLPPGDTSMSISVFPNPATLSFTVMYSSAELHSSLVIEDIMGRPVEREKLPGSEGSLTISRNKLPAGAYIIKLQGDQYFVVKLLIIQ